MKAFIGIFQHWLTLFCVISLILFAASAILALIVKEWRIFRRLAGKSAFYLLAIATLIYAGTKPPSVTVTWDEYFSNKSYSVDTNDPRRMSFAWTAPAWMPETANAILRAYSRTAGMSDVNPAASAPMSAGAMVAVMPYEATNYVFFVECDWDPSSAIVTNGVYHVPAVANAGKVVPVGVSIKLPNQGENPQ